MVVWRNIHEKKIAWSSRHVWWFKVVGAVSTIVSAYENHMSHRFSSTNQLWQSLGWSVFISQRLGFPCLFSNRLHFGIHFTFLGIQQLMKVPYNVQPPRAKLAQQKYKFRRRIPNDTVLGLAKAPWRWQSWGQLQRLSSSKEKILQFLGRYQVSLLNHRDQG